MLSRCDGCHASVHYSACFRTIQVCPGDLLLSVSQADDAVGAPNGDGLFPTPPPHRVAFVSFLKTRSGEGRELGTTRALRTAQALISTGPFCTPPPVASVRIATQ